jgi:hypothetical protein
MKTIQFSGENLITVEVNHLVGSIVASDILMERDDSNALSKLTIFVAKHVYDWAAIRFASITRGDYEVNEAGESVITVGNHGSFKIVEFRPA